MIILGIDPGLANTGWGVVDFKNSRYWPVSFGSIVTKPDRTLQERLTIIATHLKEIAIKYKVEVVSMEEIFFTKNISSAIPVAKVIGAISLQFAQMGIEVNLFSPPQIKSAVTGVGNADKNQMQQMVKVLLGLSQIPKSDHAADALADCICYATIHETMEKLKR
ncbi:MAG: crossover junction endodeoxyribonuclease RuvC [Spirochaetales bacterium]|nr:crossover junction endodeoxyribonuclease RuvC [Spirochaetales bacterium]